MMNAHAFADAASLAQETVEKYQIWYELLLKWNAKINLVAPSTLAQFWHRHALDSAQVAALAPENITHWLDLGSGGGFPGLAAAIQTRAHVTLLESNGKKVNFLRNVIRTLDLNARALQERAETYNPDCQFDIISARAFAPLPKLLKLSSRYWHENTIGLFPKGANWRSEIDTAHAHWQFDYRCAASQTDPEAQILIISSLKNI